MNISEKIKRANQLSEETERLKDFKKLCEVGNQFYNGDKDKQNKFGGLILSAYIWTGSDNPRYEKGLGCIPEVLDEIASSIIPILDKYIKLKEDELNSIIK